ncbi:MAG: hypothetical protein ACLPX5_05800 [Dissulfurispiraceae bacterium]
MVAKAGVNYSLGSLTDAALIGSNKCLKIRAIQQAAKRIDIQAAAGVEKKEVSW